MKILFFLLISFNSFCQITILNTPDVNSPDTWKAIEEIFSKKDAKNFDIILFQGKSINWKKDSLTIDKFQYDSLFPSVREIHGVSIGTDNIRQLISNNKLELINNYCIELYEQSFDEIIHRGDLEKYKQIQDSVIKYANFSHLQTLIFQYSIGQVNYATFIEKLEKSKEVNQNILFVTNNVQYFGNSKVNTFMIIPELIYSFASQKTIIKNKYKAKEQFKEYEIIPLKVIPKKINYNVDYFFKRKYFSDMQFIFISKFGID